MNELVQIKKQIEYITNLTLSQETLETLGKNAKIILWQKKHLLPFNNNKIYFIISGIIRGYYIDKNGNEITHYFYYDNMFCGAEQLFVKEQIYFYYDTIIATKVVEFDAEILNELLQNDLTLAKYYTKLLEESLIYKLKREYGFLIKPAFERLQDFKVEYEAICEQIPQSYLASYLGITPTSLSRLKRSMKNEI